MKIFQPKIFIECLLFSTLNKFINKIFLPHMLMDENIYAWKYIIISELFQVE